MNEDKSMELEDSRFQVDLRQTIYALSNALDLVGIDEVHHGKRVGYMAMLCGHKLGLDVKSINDLFELGLLHDCGVSSSRVHQQLVDKVDWSEAREHCQVGHDLVKDFSPLAHMAVPILYHHTHWEDLKHMNLAPKLSLFANLIYKTAMVNQPGRNEITLMVYSLLPQ